MGMDISASSARDQKRLEPHPPKKEIGLNRIAFIKIVGLFFAGVTPALHSYSQTEPSAESIIKSAVEHSRDIHSGLIVAQYTMTGFPTSTKAVEASIKQRVDELKKRIDKETDPQVKNILISQMESIPYLEQEGNTQTEYYTLVKQTFDIDPSGRKRYIHEQTNLRPDLLQAKINEMDSLTKTINDNGKDHNSLKPVLKDAAIYGRTGTDPGSPFEKFGRFPANPSRFDVESASIISVVKGDHGLEYEIQVPLKGEKANQYYEVFSIVPGLDYAVRKSTFYKKGNPPVPITESLYDAFDKIDGLWYPLSITYMAFRSDGSPATHNTYVINEADLNIPIPDDSIFDLAIPEGYLVYDYTVNPPFVYRKTESATVAELENSIAKIQTYSPDNESSDALRMLDNVDRDSGPVMKKENQKPLEAPHTRRSGHLAAVIAVLGAVIAAVFVLCAYKRKKS